MKLASFRTLLLAFGFSVASLSAHADLLDLNFSFDDSNGLVTGNALLTANPVASDPGAFLATAGTLVITAPTIDGISGDYKLFGNPAAPGSSYSPTGLFIYDNLLLPGANPVVTNPGVLGFGGLASGNVPEGSGREINFFSNGANTYELYTGVSGGYPYSYVYTVPNGTASVSIVSTGKANAQLASRLVAAPEPATWIIMGSFLLLGLISLRARAAGEAGLPE
jgi:hypothetical protein